MRVRVLYFGVLKDYFGESADVGLPEGARVSELLRQQRDLANFSLESIAVAVNREYAKPETVLREGDEVAFLPPVSGGGWPDGRELAALAEVQCLRLNIVARVDAD